MCSGIVLNPRYNHFMLRSHGHLSILNFQHLHPLSDTGRDLGFRDSWNCQFRYSIAPHFIQALPNRFGCVLWMNPLEECQKVCWSEFSGWSVGSTLTAWVGRVGLDGHESREIYTFLKVSANASVFLVTSSICSATRRNFEVKILKGQELALTWSSRYELVRTSKKIA